MTNERHDSIAEADEGMSPPALLTLWSYRKTIATAMAVTVVCCVIGGLLAFLLAPRERIGSLAFQLTFEGADRGEYPNGTKFSSAELVSTPVLAAVFKANELERYFPFAKFKDAMFVLQANRDLELLSYEYQSKLADAKLSPVDRSRLEEEFSKKRESLSSAGYSLNIRQPDGLVKLPDSLLNKVLQDTLSTWARQAAENKGATRYDIAVLSKNALQKDFITSEDYIISTDVLRTKIERILKTVVTMAEIPGASAVRMMPSQIGLADLRANLEDLNHFKVEPLISVIRETGLSRNPTRMAEYFRSRLFDVELARTETTQRIKSVQEALREYEQRGANRSVDLTDRSGSGVTPQLSESFIDKLVELSTESNDVEYRQKLIKRIIDDGMILAELNRQAEYYESMRRSFSEVRTRADAAVAADVTRRAGLAFDEVARMADQVEAFYKLLSQQNLNPDTVVYSLTTPFVVRKTTALSFSSAVIYFFLALLAVFIIVCLACLVHDYFRQWAVPPPATQPSGTETLVTSRTGPSRPL
jgi:hypothetical protein